MKKIRMLMLLPFVLVSLTGFAQVYDSENLDGVVFFKLKDNVPIESAEFIRNLPFMSEPEKWESFNDYPEISAALAGTSVNKLERPSYYTKKPQLMRIFRIYFTNYSEIDNIIERLSSLPFIEYAEKSPIRKIGLVPNDALYGQSSNKWYFTLVSAEQAWNYSVGSNNIKLAVVDNAVFCGHSDLTTFKQRDVADADNDATPPLDANADFTWSHGTHCAGLSTADLNNSIGMASLGGNVELIGVKCTPDNGSSNSVYYGYSGVQWACQNGANIVSMSWGGGGYSSSEQTLFNNYPNIVFFAAAGNDGTTTIHYPGGYNNVICVGSVDATDQRSSFSNYNGTTTWVDIASPGGYSNGGLLNTVYTAAGNNYGKMGGTSMATPFAAGLAGLMLSINPSLSPVDILSCITSTGASINQNIGPRINANLAVQCVLATLTGDPMANFIADNTTIAAGSTVHFTDLSNNGGNAITSWQWTFTGGTPATYTGQTPPAVTYNTIGTYNVSLTVTNSQNSDTETKNAYINVVVEPYGTWIPQATGFSAQYRGINHISIVDQNVVWGTAYDGSGNNANIQEFTKTTNGGTTWTPGTINLGNTGLGVSMIHAYDASTAWLAAYPNASGQTGGIWKTTNGGSTWTRQTTATFNNAASFTNVVYFWDANNGFCQGDPINSEFELYTTTNGGTTWTLVPGANIPAPLSGEYGYTRQIEVVGNTVWFTTNKGRIYKSTDRGLNWVVSQSPLTDFGGTTNGLLSFKDNTYGIIVSNSALVYRSDNGGSTWYQVTTTGPVKTVGLCWVEGTNIVFSTGADGSSFSQDGGVTWNPIDTDQHTAVEFKTPSLGWSGWFSASSTSEGIWKWQNNSTLEADFSGVPVVVCAGTAVQFNDLTTGGTPTSWAWTFSGGTPATSAQQNPVVTYNTPGSYDVTLTVDDGNGPVTKTITNYITVNGAPAQPSAINGLTDPCPASVTTYSVTPVPGVNYIWTLPAGWNGSSSSNTIDATVGASGGVISVTPSNSCGQGTAQTLNVTTAIDPVGSFTFTQNMNEVTFTNTSSPNGTDFFWDFGDGQWSQDENPFHIYDQIGEYEVTFFVSTSCGTDTLYDTVYITVLSHEEMLLANMTLYPVPADEYLIAEWEKIQNEAAYRISDVLGRTVLSETKTAAENKLFIPVQTLKPGVYTLYVNTGNDTAIRKFVVR
jgi:PKD repeat protein